MSDLINGISANLLVFNLDVARYYFDHSPNESSTLRKRIYVLDLQFCSLHVNIAAFNLAERSTTLSFSLRGYLAVHCEFSGNGNVVAMNTRTETDKKRERACTREKGRDVAAYFTRASDTSHL